MKKVIAVVGYGPGISKAVAERFGREGFAVGLIARNQERLNAGVKALGAAGVEAAGFVGDASNPESITGALGKLREALGPITALQWTAYGAGAGDLTTAPLGEIRAVFDVPVVGLLAAVQKVLPDLKQTRGALLVTNGGLGLFDPQLDAVGVQWGAMGLSVANSAKHKLVRLLSHKLKPEGIHVGEVVVMGIVKGTAFDQGNATVNPADVAEKFWKLFSARAETSVTAG